ncbi:MAG: HesA/MoeB/ThiF family protein [Rhizobiaceae bacterium]|nr:HesA/MoeB/ThiF family protein [Rhizobiaceae bacterium]
MNRYARQMILPEIGEAGQNRLADTRVLVIGAGGLGSPVLQYLAGAGVGNIAIVDPDRVEKSNLHRQPLFDESCIGQSKAEAAKMVLGKLNPEVAITTHVMALDAGNVSNLCIDSDIAFDCADSFAATYVASDFCFEKKIPLISASVLSANGYVGGFCGGAPSVRAVFPDIPSNLATCATAGVMGPVVGILGAMQAQMGLSILLGLDPSPLGKLMSFDGIKFATSTFRFDDAPEPTEIAFPFISQTEISPDDYVVELRGKDEVANPITAQADRLVVDDFLETRPMPISTSTKTVFVCRSGLRAWKAAKHLNRWWDGPIALVAAGTSTGENT